MERTIYENNEVVITSQSIDHVERKINVNGQNLIWISGQDEEKFKQELTDLLDKYRI